METTLATTAQVLVRLIRRQGLDAERLLRQHGIDPVQLSDPRARLPIAATDALVRSVAGQVADPSFGLQAADCWHPTNLGALGHAWLTSSTLRRGLQRLQRYWRLVGDRTAGYLQAFPGGLELLFENPRTDAVVAAVTTDMTFSVLLSMCRMNAGADHHPLEVRLLRKRPADVAPYEAFYRCPVVFDAGRRSIRWSDADVDAPLATANQQLAGIFDRILEQELARLDQGNIVGRCRSELLQLLASGEASAQTVARRLALSRRTLHRRLAEAGTSYQKLVDDTRRELAMRLVEDPQRSIGDITFELGFSQQSALTRAFRRWSGESPTAYRERRVQSA